MNYTPSKDDYTQGART